MNIDKLAIELAKTNADLSKGMPPKLKYKFSKWLRSLSGGEDKQMDRRRFKDTVKQEIIDKTAEALAKKNLRKNEVMCSAYTDGAIKFDFGSDISDSTKEAAIQWAKKRGLNPLESSLAKSRNSTESVTFLGGDSSGHRICVSRKKWIQA